MRTTIDSAGRVVIPKSIRDQLGLAGGAEVEIELANGTIELSVPPTPMRIEGTGRDVRAVTATDVPPLTQEAVRETLERVRERR
jgi:AbrB family looped-hinge helix DNA binding protein